MFQFSSVAQSCPTLCNPMNRSTPGLTVHHQLLEFTQTHVHWVGDVIQPSHPLSSPSPPAPNSSQYQGLFQWGSSSHEVAKVLEFQPQHQSFISDYCKVSTLIATTQEKRWNFAGLHLFDSSQSQKPLLQRDQKSKQDSLSFCMLITFVCFIDPLPSWILRWVGYKPFDSCFLSLIILYIWLIIFFWHKALLLKV